MIIAVKPVLELNPSEHLIVTEGEAAHLSCSLLAGSPTPHLSWSRRSRPMPGGEETVAGGELSFPAVTRHHAGHYLCSADNGFGPEPVTAQIKLTVHRKCQPGRCLMEDERSVSVSVIGDFHKPFPLQTLPLWSLSPARRFTAASS